MLRVCISSASMAFVQACSQGLSASSPVPIADQEGGKEGRKGVDSASSKL